MNVVISRSIQNQQLPGVAAVNYTRENVCTCNVILRRVRVIIVAVKKQFFHIF